MTVSAFSVIKNEAQFIGYGLMSIFPFVDEIVYFDGNSTDGTLEILDYIKAKYDKGNQIKVFRDRDFKDFKDDYVRVFNECMGECSGDYLWYVHPDMILTGAGDLENREDWKEFAYFVNMRSFAGEDMGMEITKGRASKWKTIMKRGLGLKYWGHYGHPHEDMYHEAITGESHVVCRNMRDYPYIVGDSGIKINHYCECKPRKRREQKMETVMRTAYNINEEGPLFDLVMNHPRVHLRNQNGQFGEFEFTPVQGQPPDLFSYYKKELEEVLSK